jgi:hypothetical protein
MEKIVGREREKSKLDQIMASKKSEFITVYGRRRVGKTYLIREYFAPNFDFHLTGMANVNTGKQLLNFHVTLARQTSAYLKKETPRSWIEAFQYLMDHLESIPGKRKKVVFLDELPWLDTARSDFMAALEHFWNSWATNRKDIVLVTSGSAASWMINKLINSHGGLHNRVTERIRLRPFNLRETEQFLKYHNHAVDRYQILQIYMVTGGIPFYLEALQPGKSAWQNIDDLCFRRDALLATEFPNLFASLFKKADKHEQIVEALATKRKGMTRTELMKVTGLKTGGTLTKVLNELEESGFISTYAPFNKKIRDRLYRLSDFYSMFYLRFIRDNNHYDKDFWLTTIDNPAHRAWAGYTFEQVCLAHVPQIKKALGIGGILTTTSSWQSSETGKGAQIDLVIDRRDRSINLCEAKYSINPYKITKAYDKVLRNKVGAFQAETKTRKTLYLTMITTFGLAENEYAHSVVRNQLTMDALFKAVEE